MPPQDVGPALPSWRRPPARSRREVRRLQSTVPPDARRTGRQSTAARPAAGRGLQLPSRAAVREIARRLLTLVLAGGLTFGLIQLLRMPLLTVSATSTQIGGAWRITPEQVYIASGIEGRNIFLVRPSDVEAAIGNLGGVERAQVHIRLPNQVLIDVWEHAPLVAWQAITTTVWLTAEGAPVPQTGQAPPLTLIDQIGELPDAGNARVRMLLEHLGALYVERPDVTEYHYSKIQGLSFRAPEGWDVWLGDSGPLNDKLALLDAARREILKLGQQARVIDLRFSNQRAIWW